MNALARPEVVGLAEIAQMTGRHQQTVKLWRRQGVLPDPLPGTVSGAPAWLRAEVEEWWGGYPATRRRAQPAAEI